MWTGKFNCLLLSTIALLSSCTGSNTIDTEYKPNEAWWLYKTFNTSQDRIMDIPLTEINKDWKSISVLSKDFLKDKLSQNQYKYIEQSSLLFYLKADLDKDSTSETFFVGVYENYSGETGRFLAIGKGHNIIKYFTHSGTAGYSSIYLEGSKLRWYKCMECGDYDVIYWSGSEYVLE